MSERHVAGPWLFIADLLTPDRVKIPLSSIEKTAVIGELAELLARAGGVPDAAEAIREAVLEREDVLSTGIGGGVAIPHGKTHRLDQLVLVAGTTSGPVDFQALDEQPVQVVAMLAGPESAAGLHVKVLSRICRLLRDDEVRARLVAARGPEEFLEAIRDAESR